MCFKVYSGVNLISENSKCSYLESPNQVKQTGCLIFPDHLQKEKDYVS